MLRESKRMVTISLMAKKSTSTVFGPDSPGKTHSSARAWFLVCCGKSTFHRWLWNDAKTCPDCGRTKPSTLRSCNMITSVVNWEQTLHPFCWSIFHSHMIIEKRSYWTVWYTCAVHDAAHFQYPISQHDIMNLFDCFYWDNLNWAFRTCDRNCGCMTITS